jgi:hypothetical protein
MSFCGVMKSYIFITIQAVSVCLQYFYNPANYLLPKTPLYLFFTPYIQKKTEVERRIIEGYTAQIRLR